MEEEQKQEFPIWWPALAIGTLAVIFRIIAARGELWLDEVWSLRLVNENAHSLRDILFNLKHDNNHFINSFVAYFLGPGRAGWMYRAPAVIAGSLAVFLAGWMQRRKSVLTISATVALTGFSYFLVQYSSEARGYAYEILFSILAIAMLSEADVSPGIQWEALFAAACITGFLTHPTFLIVFLAAQAWTWIPYFQPDPGDAPPNSWASEFGGASLASFIPRLVFRTIVPGLFFTWLYFAALRQVAQGGGDPQPYFSIVVQTLALALGGPFGGAGAYIIASLTLFITAAALWLVISKSPSKAGAYVLAIFVGPLLVAIFARREDIYPRYFLVSVIFLLFLWSDLVDELANRFVSSKKWITLALGLFVAANAWHIFRLLLVERGHYQDAIETMEKQTLGQHMLVVVDHPFRQAMMLDYYAHRMNLTKDVEVTAPSHKSMQAAEWLLVHSLNADFTPTPLIESEGVRFELLKHYPFAGLSGWHLCIYRRVPASTSAP